jgi:TonB family protein
MAPASAAPPEAEITLTSIPDRISAPILPKLDLKKDATAVVKLTTDSSGRVTGAIIARSSGVRSVDSAALEAARRSRFRPIRQGGRSFGSTFEIPYHFSASKKSQE